MRSTLQYTFCYPSSRNKGHIRWNGHSFQPEPPVSRRRELRVAQEYHYSHRLCHGLPRNTVCSAVRHTVDRSSTQWSHGARARQLALPGKARSSLGITHIQLSRIKGKLSPYYLLLTFFAFWVAFLPCFTKHSQTRVPLLFIGQLFRVLSQNFFEFSLKFCPPTIPSWIFCRLTKNFFIFLSESPLLFTADFFAF